MARLQIEPGENWTECFQAYCLQEFARVTSHEPPCMCPTSTSEFEQKLTAAFVDKAEGGGHNEKASLELQPRFCRGFTQSIRARMAELADAQVSEACDLTVVEVRVLFRAPKNVSSWGASSATSNTETARSSRAQFSSYRRPVQYRSSTINIISPTPLIG
jgi:hypothetical protein